MDSPHRWTWWQCTWSYPAPSGPCLLTTQNRSKAPVGQASGSRCSSYIPLFKTMMMWRKSLPENNPAVSYAVSMCPINLCCSSHECLLLKGLRFALHSVDTKRAHCGFADMDHWACLLTDRSVQMKRWTSGRLLEPITFLFTSGGTWQRAGETHEDWMTLSEKNEEAMWQHWWQSEEWGGKVSECPNLPEEMKKTVDSRQKKGEKPLIHLNDRKRDAPSTHTHYFLWPKKGFFRQEPFVFVKALLLNNIYPFFLPCVF